MGIALNLCYDGPFLRGSSAGIAAWWEVRVFVGFPNQMFACQVTKLLGPKDWHLSMTTMKFPMEDFDELMYSPFRTLPERNATTIVWWWLLRGLLHAR